MVERLAAHRAKVRPDVSATAADLASFGRALGVLPRAAFGTCICGRGIEDHGRIKPSGNPEYEYRCAHTPSGKFTAQDGSRWPHGPAGVAA